MLPNIVPKVYLSWDSTPPATLDFGLQGTAGIDVQVAGDDVLSVNTPAITLFEKTIWQASTAQTTPVLNLVAPNNATKGSSNLTLNLSGYDFPFDSVVIASGKPLKTSYLSSQTLWATLPSAEMLRTGTLQISIVDPSSGATSDSLQFAVTPINQTPVITSLSPGSLPAGSSAQTLSVYGKNFRPGAVVTLGGAALGTTYISANQLNVSLAQSDLRSPGSFPVVVTSPPPDGGPSAPIDFVVTSKT